MFLEGAGELIGILDAEEFVVVQFQRQMQEAFPDPFHFSRLKGTAGRLFGHFVAALKQATYAFHRRDHLAEFQ